MSALQVIWYFLLGALLTGFAVLDGFDLGVGVWHLRARGDAERRTLLNAIGPLWDGNEVWLITAGGALFAAFPPAYATLFSGFYTAMMLLVFCLIARAVSLEFRSKGPSQRWRASFDAVFSLSSVFAGIIFGLALGNVLRGVPMNERGDYTGTILDLFNPYALLISAVGLAMLAFHGASFIAMKTQEELQERARRWTRVSGIAYLSLFAAATASTIVFMPHLMENFYSVLALWVIPAAAASSIALSLRFGRKDEFKKAFLMSAVSVSCMMGTAGASLFPRLVPSLHNPSFSLTAANSSSSELTLAVMLVMAFVGMPLVLGYTIWAYRAFSGKVDVESPSNHY